MSKKIVIFWFLGIVSLVLFIAFIPKVVGHGSCYSEYGKLTCVNMKEIANALKMFKMDNGNYPTKEEGLKAL